MSTGLTRRLNASIILRTFQASRCLPASRLILPRFGRLPLPTRDGVLLMVEGVLPMVERFLLKGEYLLPLGESVLPKGEGILLNGESVLPKGEGILLKGESVLPL